ncbi:MAG: helix-turn-helix domain-containing protein [Rhodospirillaceae bacterium]|nr:helix-turn-helix domain-containing protein [Rhodospirillaceae bacterium]
MDDDIQDDEDLGGPEAALQDAALQGTSPGQIRALTRGLAVLEALNQRPGATVTEIAGATGLARTTAYRVLETLCAGGFAARAADERYQLLTGVRRLADGAVAEKWITEIARPAAANLAKDLAWPLYLATPHGAEMLLHRLGEPGLPPRVPLTASAAGIAYLAALPEAARIAAATTAGPPQTPTPILDRGVAALESDGALWLAVAVLVANWPVGCLTVGVPNSALSGDQRPSDQSEAALDRIIGLLTGAAVDVALALRKT